MARSGPEMGHLRLPADLIRDLKAAADARAVSATWLATHLLRDNLERLVPPDQIKLTRD